MNQKVNRRADNQRILFWMVFSAAVLLFAWGMWSVPVLSHNEARRLVVVREMIASQQWLTPMKNGVFYFEKPPLYYWTGVFFSLLSGSTAEWVLRLPSALAALAATGFLYQRMRTYIGRQPALFSALILVSSQFYVLQARRAEIDTFFATLCFAALLLYYDFFKSQKKKYLYFSFIVLGLAALTKGPVALVFFLSPLVGYALLRRNFQILKGLFHPLGWLLFATFGLSWFAYAFYGIPDSPLRGVIQKDIVAKVYESANFDPFYSYFVLLLGSFAPWTLVLFYKPKRWLKNLSTPEGMFLTCAFGVPLIIMSCFATKHGKYMLPVFPFLAAFLGCAVSGAYNDFGQRWGERFHTLFNRLSGGLLAILFIALVMAPPYTLKYRFVILKPFAEKLHSLRGTNPVFSYNQEQIQLIYYYGEPIPVLDETQFKEKLKQGQPFLIVAEDSDRAALEEEKNLCRIEEFSPYLETERKAFLYGTQNFCQLHR